MLHRGGLTPFGARTHVAEAGAQSVDRDIWKSSGYRRPAGEKLGGWTWIKGRVDGQDIGETKAPSRSKMGGLQALPAAGAGPDNADRMTDARNVNLLGLLGDGFEL